jgi:CRISPR-associated protein Csm2
MQRRGTYPQQREESPEQKYKRIKGEHFGGDPAAFFLSPKDYNAWNDQVEEFVKGELKEISTHQLRNIFSAVKSKNEPEDIPPLRYKLAYVAGRAEGKGKKQMKLLYLLMDELMKSIGKDEERLKNFQRFFEAIIAYHKYFFGK